MNALRVVLLTGFFLLLGACQPLDYLKEQKFWPKLWPDKAAEEETGIEIEALTVTEPEVEKVDCLAFSTIDELTDQCPMQSKHGFFSNVPLTVYGFGKCQVRVETIMSRSPSANITLFNQQNTEILPLITDIHNQQDGIWQSKTRPATLYEQNIFYLRVIFPDGSETPTRPSDIFVFDKAATAVALTPWDVSYIRQIKADIVHACGDEDTVVESPGD